MNSRRASAAPPAFVAAAQALRDLRLRPEVALEEIPAPQRIAPHSLALSAEVVSAAGADPSANGRFVLLHDPSAPEAWESTWRVVTFASAELEAELASDPLLGEVGWSWLTDALGVHGAEHRALGGTVTRVVSESFGALSDREPAVEMEVRASWSPVDDDITGHLHTWAELLCTVAGLPPLPAGVSAMPARRR
ncbi:DUF3000 domain-containing protein [Agilicoccus flavus]|uniref:DUF3000 domain-containing protein n=1 Tax=Agilicoccus flavus TaxID=2775968 RepID=UPI001CF61533|nr:DUF3000 domain-containing protein [Agilicoccus flavus]